MRDITPLGQWEVGQESSETVPGISQPSQKCLVMHTEAG